MKRRDFFKAIAGFVAGIFVAFAPKTIGSKRSGTRQVATVKDYGAIGDGKTDDTKAIQRALDDDVSLFTEEIYLTSSGLIDPTIVWAKEMRRACVKGLDDTIIEALG